MSHVKPVLEVIKNLTGIVVREKAPTVVGARMGRPEKAKRREMHPLVHALFPTGLAGGSQRNLAKASSKAVVEVELAKRRCPSCREVTFKVKCPGCEVLLNVCVLSVNALSKSVYAQFVRAERKVLRSKQ
jgi:hypothetical protein